MRIAGCPVGASDASTTSLAPRFRPSRPRIADEPQRVRSRLAFDEDAAPFISARHGIKIGVRLGEKPARPGADRPGRTAGSDSALAVPRPSAVAELMLSDLSRSRPSAIIATSDAQTKPWSRTLIEVNTKGKKARRKSAWRR